jgi:lipoprotein LprG
MKRPLLITAAVLAVTLLASGCSGETGGLSAEERLAIAQTTLATTDAAKLAITSEGTPANADGVQAATGTVVLNGDVPKFEGEIKGRMGGVSATIAILVHGDDAYMKLFTPNWEPVDLDQFGAPNPTKFFDAATGIPSLIAATAELKLGDQVREGSEVLTEITGTITGDRVKALLMIGSPERTYKVTYALTDTNELRRATLSGELWEGVESTYSMLITDYGKVIEITDPTAGK